eukprot:469144-Rhodomonas_salina.1
MLSSEAEYGLRHAGPPIVTRFAGTNRYRSGQYRLARLAGTAVPFWVSTAGTTVLFWAVPGHAQAHVRAACECRPVPGRARSSTRYVSTGHRIARA